MKAGLLVAGIVFLVCCAEFHSANGNTQVQVELSQVA
jgi:hypothetical protein